MSHSLVAKHFKIPIDQIQLFFFGGVAFMRDEHTTPKTEFLMAIAGPISSFVLAATFFAMEPYIYEIHLAAIIHYLARINMVLAIFNLAPGFPLDGGRALRAIIWFYTGNYQTATYYASKGGKFVAGILIFLGFINIFAGNFGGLWFVIIGGFLYFLAEMSFEQAVLKQALAKVYVKDIMQKKFKKLSPTQKIDDVIKDYFLPLRKEAFPVFDETKLIGFLTMDNVKRIPLSLRHKTKVKNALTPVSRFSRFKENDNLYKALVKVAGNEQAIFPVFRGKKLVGILSHTQVMSYIRTKMSLGA